MTLKQVADAIGVSEATAQRYESGKISTLKYDKAAALANLFNVSPGYLMGWDYDFQSLENTPSTWTEKDHAFLYNMIMKYGDDEIANRYSAAGPMEKDDISQLIDVALSLDDDKMQQLINYAKFLSQEEK